ncbi:hypothetical protein P4679_25735 [Priestia megaterium]|uniref:hypothetical protein n=1 Tax=Priestia megaterium TaxID=1404 RepID=UPI002E1DE69B|nr:hypothetical protein [Priestia megaterium]
MNQVAENKGINELELGKVIKFEELLSVSYKYNGYSGYEFYLDKNTGKGVNFSSQSHTQWDWAPIKEINFKELKEYLANANDIMDPMNNTDDMFFKEMMEDVRKSLVSVNELEQAEKLLEQRGYSGVKYRFTSRGDRFFKGTTPSKKTKDLAVQRDENTVSIYESEEYKNKYKKIFAAKYLSSSYTFQKGDYKDELLKLFKYAFRLCYENLLQKFEEVVFEEKIGAFAKRVIEKIQNEATEFVDIISLAISEFNSLIIPSGYKLFDEQALEFKNENKLIYSFIALLETDADKI